MNKLVFILLLLLLINISFARKRSYIKNTDTSIVVTQFGAIKGIVEDTHRVFYGVPFAQPPVNQLRWENPIDLKPWENVRETLTQKSQCAQKCNLGPGVCSPMGTSEDSLYQDIFTPKDARPNSKYPVIVYIPGGAFSVGSGFLYLFMMLLNLLHSSVIVVNINYRLGVLGLMGTDLMHGNYGFLDQIKALEWVYNNIGFLGGNKEMITIWGESAGAFSVSAHLTSTYSRQYFNAAISSSSPLTVGLKDKTTARGNANRFATNVGCNIEDLTCLRGKSMDEILDGPRKIGLTFGYKILDAFTIWSPVIDGDIIPMQTLTDSKGRSKHMMFQHYWKCKHEAIPFIYSFSKIVVGIDYYRVLVAIVFPLNAMKILPLYPAAPRGQDSRPILSELITDYLFRCPDRYHTVTNAKKLSSPTYHYHYVHVKSTGHSLDACDDKVCHGTELSLFFNSYELMGERLDNDEKELAIDINNYIVNLQLLINPNTGLDVPVQWRQVTCTQNSTLILETTIETKVSFTNDPKCNALDLTYYRNQVRP
uniref:Probable esterase D2 n=1 Tax=Dictyostelium sp. TaxID=5784 RepID=Q7M441_9MYCE